MLAAPSPSSLSRLVRSAVRGVFHSPPLCGSVAAPAERGAAHRSFPPPKQVRLFIGISSLLVASTHGGLCCIRFTLSLREKNAAIYLVVVHRAPYRMPAVFSSAIVHHQRRGPKKVRRSVAIKGKMPVKDVELKLLKGGSRSSGGGGDDGGGETSIGSRGGDYGSGGELRSAEALDRSNSRRLGDLGLR